MNEKIKRESSYKQMAFDTAVRNPERYKGILKELFKFEGMILNDEVLLEIILKMYKNKIVGSNKIQLENNDAELKRIIISINSSRKADGGFPSGYASRFWTYVRTLNELGFIFARYNKKLFFSSIAKQMIGESVKKQISEQVAFMVQASIFNRKSPYRNVKNDFNYFKFITKFLIKKWNENCGGITYEQFIVSLFSEDGDIDNFENIVSNQKFKSVEQLSEFLKNKYGVGTKIKTICREYPDVVLRVLKITGFISLKRDTGKLIIKINEEKISEINEIFKNDFSFTEEEKNSDLKFFEKYSKYSEQLLNVVNSKNQSELVNEISDSIKLKNIILTYDINIKDVSKLIINFSKNKFEERFEVFKYIPAPTRLEFYISLLLQISYGDNFEVKPNYKSDSEGIPISHAPGNMGDIEVVSNELYWLVEVTLIENKSQQLNFETTSVIRHMNADSKSKYLSLIAPKIHEDTKVFYENEIIRQLGKQKEIVYIKPFSLVEFIGSVINNNVLEAIKSYTEEYLEEKKKLVLSIEN